MPRSRGGSWPSASAALQLREKALPDRELLAAAEAIAALWPGPRARPGPRQRPRGRRSPGRGLGVHLGRGGSAGADGARAAGAGGASIGVSTHDVGRRRAAPSRTRAPTTSRSGRSSRARRRRDGRPAASTELARGGGRAKTKPLVAIGGITLDRLDAVWDAGADSAAMIGGLFAGGRIEENARAALDRARRRRRRRPDLPRRIHGERQDARSGGGSPSGSGLPFVDLDEEIERTAGRTIRALFEESGEAAFRERESRFLAGHRVAARAPSSRRAGGCFGSEENRRTIGRLGTSVLLDVSLETVRARLAGKTDRPLFRARSSSAALFAERAPFYRMATVPRGFERRRDGRAGGGPGAHGSRGLRESIRLEGEPSPGCAT